MRKVKCDEVRPRCGACTKLQFACDWPGVDGKVVVTQRRKLAGSPQRQNARISSAERELRPAGLPITLTRSLVASVPCTNSILLSGHDRLFLEYFPMSTVYYMWSPRRWNALSYVADKTAASSSMVMHMILAISASEMQRKNLIADRDTCGADLGLHHYTAALQDLMKCIQPNGSLLDGAGLEPILATLFFMINYGLQTICGLNHAKTHMAGVRSLFTSHIRYMSAGLNGRKVYCGPQPSKEVLGLSPLSAQLLLYILYSDIGATCLKISNELIDLFTEPSNRLLSIYRLEKIALHGLPTLWGEEYPQEYHLDDLQTLRAKELLTNHYLLWSRIWRARANTNSEQRARLYSSFMNEITRLRETFADVFVKSPAEAIERDSTSQGGHNTIKAMVGDRSVILFCWRWLGTSGLHEPIHRDAVADVVGYHRAHFVMEQRSMVRCSWPLFIAAIETTNIVDQNWLAEKLYECRNLSAECYWCWSTAKDIQSLQSGPKQQWVDLSKYIAV
ncbi:hypothetical protein F4778DRAFT_722302 [Xylariomycetidae sp. FL2044]|nr:hypothetical protein F4778DRAFT_722302 [Xylariomycetidae sp. FL2044]